MYDIDKYNVDTLVLGNQHLIFLARVLILQSNIIVILYSDIMLMQDLSGYLVWGGYG